MKKVSGILLLVASVLGTAHANEQNLATRFERVRAIDGTFAVGDRGRLVVPSEVFGQARDFPTDLRILADDGTQWPFFLHIPQERIETHRQVPEILNRSWVDGRTPYLQFDLLIPQEGDRPPVHNQLELTTSGRDFVRRVEIYNAEGNGLMAVGHLIDFSGQRGARNRIVCYPPSDAARLHIRIFSNARNADETFTLSAAQLRSRTPVEVEREPVEATRMKAPRREEEKGAQTLLFDLGEPNRPLDALVFEVQTPSFARSVSVYGRNSEHEPWKWVGGGEIHALQNDRQLEIGLSRARHRYIKLHLFHYDDAPLDIQSIRFEAVPRYLVFEAATAGQARLYYRAWDLKPPRYDLKGRIGTPTLATLPIFQTLETAPNEQARNPLAPRVSKWIGIGAVGGVSLLVIGIIARMLKQQRETP